MADMWDMINWSQLYCLRILEEAMYVASVEPFLFFWKKFDQKSKNNFHYKDQELFEHVCPSV